MIEKVNKAKISKEDIKVLLIFLVNVIIIVALIGIIGYLVWGNNGVMERNKQKEAKEKLDRAVQAFANEEYENIFDAISEIEGYEEIEEKQEGIYNITIDGYDMILTQYEIYQGKAEG